MACSVEEIHEDDIGTIFIVPLSDCDVVADVSTAITKEIIFLKPDATTLTKTATFVTDGTDGKIAYTTVAGDLDQTGGWKVQAKVELPTGTWNSSITKFKVWGNLV